MKNLLERSIVHSIQRDLKLKANPEKSRILQSFFKTAPGQYGEGDVFYGLTVPEQRNIAKQFTNLNLENLQALLNSKVHEERMISLLILVDKYEKTKNPELVKFYIKNAKRINNWDLVDVTAPRIVGDYLLDKPLSRRDLKLLNLARTINKTRSENKGWVSRSEKVGDKITSNLDRKVLYKLARSKNLWEKRIAIVSTYTFIKNNQLTDTLKISKILLKDKHDLIHKAIGWMLREVGKKDEKLLIRFLRKNYSRLPRTTLRYAIERFPEKKRKHILNGNFN